MKKIILTLAIILSAFQLTYAQWTNVSGTGNYYLNSGYVGIGTTTPSLGVLQINGTADLLSLYSNASVLQFNAYNNSDFRIIQRSNAVMTFWTNTVERMRLDQNGNFGIGTTTPLTNLHITGAGTSIDGSAQATGGGLIVQGNTGSRSSSNGAQLEFVIPANTDGTNLWGQARIITVAGNASNGNATGKMILGTRRYFNKIGAGTNWYYGNDLTIDGNGFIGINTTDTKGYMLAVNGSVIAVSVNIKPNATWPDYVFKPTYQLPSLADVKTYIDQNQHLPEMPTAADVAKDGINVGQMNTLLTKKVEELTLYLIEQAKELKQLKDRLEKLETTSKNN